MEEIIVNVSEGLLRGKVSRNYKNGQFYSFFGIPYALPPLDELRFKPPQPPKRWEGIRDATRERNGCISRHSLFRKVEGSEDCLLLNVYSPMTLSTNNVLKPVMVWIHGGLFVMGSATTDLYGPEFLLTQDIVLVTVNYRLGALGFLCLEDTSLGVTGNNGLRDIIMALKWINLNIKVFYGDPKNVTLFGGSSGGACVHYLMLSPIVKVILHGGSALNFWANGDRSSARKLADVLGLASGSDKEILEFLRQQPIQTLYDGQTKILKGNSPHIQLHFCPVIEKVSPIITPVITENPAEIIASGQYNRVPMMMGLSSSEGNIFEYKIKNIVKSNSKAVLVPNFEHLIPYDMNIPADTPLSRYTADKIKSFYFNGEEPILTKHRNAFYEVLGDAFFNYKLTDAAVKHLDTLTCPIYFFIFSVDGEFNFLRPHRLPGATHNEDLFYLFKVGCKVNKIVENSLEDITIQRMVKLWTNFAKFGNPNSDDFKDINWKPIEPTKLHYLDIGENLTVGVNPKYERFIFWDKIYKMHLLPGKM
ncbi:Carboxylesterase family [Popillia japonica]|uniref:Carboxylesterase family n=1 Tax=Popillia japonica TaxID=7064 RepID=A0AAW1MJL5_POPJA